MSPIIIIGNTLLTTYYLTLPKRKVLTMNLHSMVKTPVQELQKLKHKHAAEFKRKEEKRIMQT